MLNSILLQITTVATADSTIADTAHTGALQMAQPAAAMPTEDSLQLIDLLLKGGPIMIPLAFLSVVTIYFFFERFFVIRKASKIDPLFMNNIKDFVHNGNIEAAKALCKATATPLARMVERGVSKIGKPIKEIEAAIESTGKLELFKVEKNLNILSIIGRVAPILGFIGTIIGVIVIFYDIGLSGDIAIKTISKGLYQKMISSVSGLTVGLLAYIGYFVINTMIDRLLFNLESASIDFIELLQQPSK